MTFITERRSAYRPTRRFPGLNTILAAWRSRQVLARLDDRALTDIGLSRKEAQTEAAKPIWDVPDTWRY